MKAGKYHITYIFLIFILFLPCLAIAQVTSPDNAKKTDTLKVKSDSIIKGDIETTIKYYAKDSIVSDIIEQILYLSGDAKITYGKIELTATQIEINQKTNIVTARRLPDSLGRLRGTPKFTDAGETYEADSMRYNFKTQRGVIQGGVTKQGEGFMSIDRAKRDAAGIIYGRHGKYTTSNLKHPHWYIDASKIKLIPEKQVITGPFNMVVSDVPSPLGFAFGIFPFTEKTIVSMKRLKNDPKV